MTNCVAWKNKVLAMLLAVLLGVGLLAPLQAGANGPAAGAPVGYSVGESGDEIPEGTIKAKITLDGVLHTESVRAVLYYRYTTPDGRDRMEYIGASYSENGYVTFENLPASDKYFFIVQRVEGSHAYYHGYRSGEFLSSNAGVVQELPLITGETVSTTVTLDGKAAANVPVYIHGFGSASGHSDANGIATFTNIAAYNQTFFWVERVEGKYAEYYGELENEYFTVPSSAYPNIKLETGVALAATLTLKGQPLKNTEVTLWRLVEWENEEWIWHTADKTTDNNGLALISNIHPGTYVFEYTVYDDDYWPIAEYYTNEFTVPQSRPLTLELDADYIPPVSISSSSKSKGGSSGGSGVSKIVSDVEFNPGGNTTTNTFGAPVDKDWAIKEVKTALNALNVSGQAVVRVKNPSTISLDIMKEMVSTAGTAPVLVNADTLNGTGGVDVRLSFSPSTATKDINLHASTLSENAKKIQARFEKHFSNKLMVISFAQKSEFGMPVQVAAKLSDGINTDNLHFYTYDSATNIYNRLNVSYTVDGNGFVKFTTTVGGDILIVDNALARK